MDSDFHRKVSLTGEIRASSLYNNPYYFQGKRLDILAGGDLELMHWPYRDYSTYLGRWLQPEKRGTIPNDDDARNAFDPLMQYADGGNYYEAFASAPLVYLDTYGLWYYANFLVSDRAKERRTLVLPTWYEDGGCPFTKNAKRRLARFMGLNYRDFDRWATPYNRDGKCGYMVPNTAYIDASSFSWGVLGWGLLGYRDGLRNRWKNEGLHVVYTGPWSVTKELILSHLSSEDIYKFAYIGHGSVGCLTAMTTTDPNDPSPEVICPTTTPFTNYHISEMHLIACETNEMNWAWKYNVSRPGILTTVKGILRAFRWDLVTEHGE